MRMKTKMRINSKKVVREIQEILNVSMNMNVEDFLKKIYKIRGWRGI